MKTITGSVISSKPVRLSKAASVLKNFISKETGASDAVSAFLRRSSAAFSELAQFHKELGSRKSASKQRKRRSEGLENGEAVDNNGKKLYFGGEESLKYVENGLVGSDVEGSKEKKTERKKRGKEEKSRSLDDSEELHGRKKKKRRHEE